MANTRTPRETTAPKGHRTRRRDQPVALPPRDTVTLQWIGVGLLVAALIAVAAYFARDQEPGNIHGGGANSAGLVVEAHDGPLGSV